MNRLTPQRWQQVKDVLAAALERPPDTRDEFLATACADDTTLWRETASLLAQHDGAAGLLDRFADGPAGGFWREPDTLPPGRRIGSYEIVRELGRGGMGAVFLARRGDRQFEKQVAIKLIKRGMDTDAIVLRFRAERQILAHLDHPNIARLLDGGTTDDGLPYFIMEYVDGVPITRYADERGLSTAARLRLFRQVCAAVHFAHQRLVLHRDLKPGNILVTAEGEPKLLDFGVGKLLDPTLSEEDAGLTLTGQHPMTPAYASPEQAAGGEVTTASDVYSLGALLYELLAGRAPYQFGHAPAHEVARAICEDEPARPGAVARAAGRRLPGDLDKVVLMAMRKEPARRYASAAQFSADVGAFLEGLPVRARKDTLPYRTRKFVARNKGTTAGALLVALALVAGTVTTAWQARVARSERARAERRFNDVRRMANSFLFELDDEIGKGPTKARHLLVRRAREYLDSLAQEANGDATLQRELAAAYLKLGDVQSRLNDANVGDTAGALESYRKALALQGALLAAPTTIGQAEHDALRRELAGGHQRLGDMLSKTGHTAEALDEYRRAVSLLTLTAWSGELTGTLPLVRSYVCLGRALVHVGDLGAAVEQTRLALAALEELPAATRLDHAWQREDTRLRQFVGFLASMRGLPREALEDYRRNVVVHQAWLDADPADATARRSLMDSEEWVAIALDECGETAQALAEHRRALALCQAALEADPTNMQARNDAADVLHETGNTLLAQGDANGALASYRQALDHYGAVVAADPINVHARRQHCLVQEESAGALEIQGRIAEALAQRQQDLAVLTQLTALDPRNVRFQRDEALCLSRLGQLWRQTAGEHRAEAEDCLRRAEVMLERIAALSPLNAEVRADLTRTQAALGR